MKLATLAFIAATVAIPAAAFADSSQPNSSPGAAAPAGQMQKNTGAAMKNGGQTAGDSSVPAATNPNQANTKGKAPATTGAKAGDSSVPAASR